MLLGSVELRNVNPQVFLSTLDLLRTALTCTLLWTRATPLLTGVYYDPPHIVLDAPAVVRTYNCSDLNTTIAAFAAGDARVAAWYTFENTTEIMNMNIIQFNTMILHSPYIKDYKRIVGASALFPAGPAELLHLPGPVPYSVLPTNSAVYIKLSLLAVLAHMVAASYIAAAAGT